MRLKSALCVPASARALATTFALAALPVAAHAQHIIGARDVRALRADSVFRRFDRSDAPGCALGVYQNGQML